jgi:hypothetical protein
VSAAAAAVTELAGALALRGVALFGADRAMLASGRLGGSDAQLLALAGSARQLFRQTQPPLSWINLEFTLGHVAVLLVGDNLLLLRSDAPLDPALVQAALAARAAALAAFSGEPRASLATGTGGASAATTAPPSPAHLAARALEALNVVARAARGVLGGPVVRNYLRKARTDLREPVLEGYQVDLEGVVTLPDGQPAATPRPLGAWAGALRTRASAVVPELGRGSLRAITPDHAAELAATGFYPDEP